MCFLRASRRIDRCVVALRGREGWLGLLIKASSDVDDVVGNAKGYGIVSFVPAEIQNVRFVFEYGSCSFTLFIASQVATANVSWGKSASLRMHRIQHYRGNRSASRYAI